MLSPGQVAFRGYTKNEGEGVIPWQELSDAEKQRYENAGKEVVDFYARIMNTEDHVFMDQIIGLLSGMDAKIDEIHQEVVTDESPATPEAHRRTGSFDDCTLVLEPDLCR